MNLLIERTLDLEAAPERVWRAITDAEQLAKWFPDRAVVDLTPGGEGKLIWQNSGVHEFEVVEVDPPRRLVWRWAGGEDRPLQDYATTVEWTLIRREDGGTTLSLRESGFDNEKGYRDNSQGWTSELRELVDYLAA